MLSYLYVIKTSQGTLKHEYPSIKSSLQLSLRYLPGHTIIAIKPKERLPLTSVGTD